MTIDVHEDHFRHASQRPSWRPSRYLAGVILGFMSFFRTPADDASSDALAPKTERIEVIGTTPLEGTGVPIEQVPANVQIATGEKIQKQRGATIADFMSQSMAGFNINETRNNPFQPNLNLHGFTASSSLGTSQGLSVFYDGVRINEPFGDAVNLDLIPLDAIAVMTVIPGSNPVFGLNTLGGAISLQTKSGRTSPGGAIDVSGGSWTRRSCSSEYGGAAGSVDYFFSANVFDEDGWRKASPTKVRQFFGKLGWQSPTTSVDLSLTSADNHLVGNGLTQKDLLDSLGWDSINTKPDDTHNGLAFLNLKGSRRVGNDALLSGNVYYRSVHTRTLNGDVNENVDAAMFLQECGDGADAAADCGGALNRSDSRGDRFGLTAQLNLDDDWLGMKDRLAAGAGYDLGRTDFTQSTEFGNITPDRGVNPIGVFSDDAAVDLRAQSSTWSLYATNTLSLTRFAHLTLSGRYDRTTIENRDHLRSRQSPRTLTADSLFKHFNPAIGLAVTPDKDLSFYVGYDEGSRAPSAIELGCANPDFPCKLPNALAGDPPLHIVVSRTLQGGARGRLARNMEWSTSVFRSQNADDIQFIASRSTGAGYFSNVGTTRRQGLDIALNREGRKVSWFAAYSHIEATYRGSFSAVSEGNSSAVDTDGDGEGDTIRVDRGDTIPGIPKHQLKLGAEWHVLSHWSVGANVLAFSEQYTRGNENNEHRGEGGKTPRYALMNLESLCAIGRGWQVFAKLNNVFDKRYLSGGLLGESFFRSDGSFDGGKSHGQPLYAPGAPRAGWVGLRYEFGGKQSSVDVD